VTNTGLIRGQTGAGIAVTGAATPYTLKINNRAGGTIKGGGSEAAISTGANNAVVTNAGTITATGSGRAIDLGSGNSTVNIRGASAQVNGDISGGTGQSRLSIAPGKGNRFAYSGNISHFDRVTTGAGTVILDGHNTYAGPTRVKGGQLIVGIEQGSAASVTSTIRVLHGGTLAGNGRVGTASIAQGATLAPGTNGIGSFDVGGPLDLNGSLAIDLAGVAGFDQLVVDGIADFGANSLLALNLLDPSALQIGQTFDVMTARVFDHFSRLGLQGLNIGSGLRFDAADVNMAGGNGQALRLTVRANDVPEPGAFGLLGLGLLLVVVGVYRRRARIGGSVG
jgi:autotransporter-associated beta strand protein